MGGFSLESFNPLSPLIALYQADYDKLLAYHTKQQVNVLDRFLGFMNYLLLALIMAYVIGFVFIYSEGYLEFESAKGILVAHTTGDAIGLDAASGKTRYFAADDINYPGLENGNVFIATRVSVDKQERGVCEDMTKMCMSAADCSKDVGAECSPDHFCKEPSWCSKQKIPNRFKLDTDTMRIWVKSAIQFQVLSGPHNSRFFTMGVENPIPFPEPHANTYTVRDLLLICDPPVRFEEVSELGAAIEIQFVWNCNVNLGEEAAGHFGRCFPKISARRIDSLFDEENIGFSFKYPWYTGEDQRELVQMSGIRFYLRTVGTGQKVSLTVIILKLSTGASLIGFAPILVDLMMLNLFKLSQKYKARKYIESEDFSKYMDMLGKSSGDDSDGDETDDDEEADLDWKKAIEEDL